MINLEEIIIKYPESLDSASKFRSFLKDIYNNLYDEDKLKADIISKIVELGLADKLLYEDNDPRTLKLYVRQLANEFGYSERLSIICLNMISNLRKKDNDDKHEIESALLVENRNEDDETRFIYLLERAKNGEIEAYANIGNMYFYGEGVVQDYKKAIRWYKRGVKEGDPIAMYNLANCYWDGLGVSVDFFEAKRLYKLSAKAGYSLAYSNLAFCYQYGYGCSQDIYAAITNYEKAAELGDELAESNLGAIYGSGEFFSPDYEKAVYWLKRAVKHNSIEATEKLAISYIYGLGVERCVEKGLSYMKKAAETRASAQFCLGYLYIKGEIVPQNIDLGVQWISKAAVAGDERAKKFLTDIGVNII